MRISADSRYKLYVNGRYVLAGPLKGDRFRKYYDEVDLTPYLHTGNNVVAGPCAPVPAGLSRRNRLPHGRGFSGKRLPRRFSARLSACPAMNTSTQWKWFDDASYRFVEACESKYAGDQEAFDGRLYEAGWQEAGYDDSRVGKPTRRYAPAATRGWEGCCTNGSSRGGISLCCMKCRSGRPA